MKRLTTIIFALFLTACGWQLRGGLDTSSLDSVYVSGAGLGSTMSGYIVDRLRSQGVNITNSRNQAQYHIQIQDEKFSQRTVSIGSNARAAEYLLSQELTIKVADSADNILIPELTLRAERNMDFDEEQVIAKAAESDIIRKELQEEIVRQLVDRLQHLNTAQ